MTTGGIATGDDLGLRIAESEAVRGDRKNRGAVHPHQYLGDRAEDSFRSFLVFGQIANYVDDRVRPRKNPVLLEELERDAEYELLVGLRE